MNKGRKISAKAKRKKAKPTQKGKEKVAEIRQEVPTEESQAEKPPAKKEKPPAKKDTKPFEQLGCMCCGKQLWVKDPAGQLIPGCSCGIYLPGHAKCGKCSLHCPCEGRVHG